MKQLNQYIKESLLDDEDDLMYLTNPTESQYKHMWCTRVEYDNFNS